MELDVKVEAEFLAAALQQPDLIDPDILVAVQPEYFQVDSYQWLVKLLQQREWKPPVFDFLDQELLSITDPESRDKFRNQLYALYTRELSFVEDASDKFRAYISFCIVNTKIREAFEGFGRSHRIEFLVQDIEEGLLTAHRVVEVSKLAGIDYADNYVDRRERRKQDRNNPKLNPRIVPRRNRSSRANSLAGTIEASSTTTVTCSPSYATGPWSTRSRCSTSRRGPSTVGLWNGTWKH